MNNKRMSAALRRADILDAGLRVAERHLWHKVTREMVAEEAGIKGPTVQYHFGSVEALRAGIMQHAIDSRSLLVLARGLASEDTTALTAPDDLQDEAREHLRRRVVSSGVSGIQ